MRIAMAVLAIPFSVVAFGQEATINRDSVWMDTVKQGDLAISVRGLGVVSANKTVELKVPEMMSKEIEQGQPASLEAHDRHQKAAGKVASVGTAADGMVPVLVEFAGAAPAWARPGVSVDGTIHVRVLNDVIYVGRPVMSRPEGEGILFKLDPDGQHAMRVKVQYGRASVDTVQVRSGLRPGDRVILSDMSAHNGQEKLRMQ